MTLNTSGDVSELGLRGQRSAWILVGGVWAGYFIVRALEVEPAVRLLKGLLMPALLLWVVVALGDRAPRWLVIGLVMATIGDVAIDISFELGILGFLLMQVCYIIGFLQMGAAAGIRRRWPVALGYLGIWLAVNLGLGGQFGDLRIPVLVYSAAICLMAALAAGVGPRVGWGAALFLVSDMFIAFGQADIDFVLRSAIIMPTYLAGQYLIATGWARSTDPKVRIPI